MIAGLSEKGARRMADAFICGCGKNLVVGWDGANPTARLWTVRCLADPGHETYQQRPNTRILADGKEYDKVTQKPVGTQEIVKYQTDQGPMELSVRSIKQHLCPKATDEEAYMFLRLCEAQRLNPFIREAYLIIYGSGERRRTSMVVGRDAYIRRAEAHADFDGFDAGVITDAGEVSGSYLPEGSKLVGGWAKVYRKGRERPHYVRVALKEYNTGQNQWVNMPATMIRKVAIVQGLREVFPTVMAGANPTDLEDVVDGEVVSDTAAPPAAATHTATSSSYPGVPAAAVKISPTSTPRATVPPARPHWCAEHKTSYRKVGAGPWQHPVLGGPLCLEKPQQDDGATTSAASTADATGRHDTTLPDQEEREFNEQFPGGGR